MNNSLDPQSLGLHPRTLVEKVAPDTMAIIIERKSRIIMADGKKVLAKVEKKRSYTGLQSHAKSL